MTKTQHAAESACGGCNEDKQLQEARALLRWLRSSPAALAAGARIHPLLRVRRDEWGGLALYVARYHGPNPNCDSDTNSDDGVCGGVCGTTPPLHHERYSSTNPRLGIAPDEELFAIPRSLMLEPCTVATQGASTAIQAHCRDEAHSVQHHDAQSNPLDHDRRGAGSGVQPQQQQASPTAHEGALPHLPELPPQAVLAVAALVEMEMAKASSRSSSSGAMCGGTVPPHYMHSLPQAESLSQVLPVLWEALHGKAPAHTVGSMAGAKDGEGTHQEQLSLSSPGDSGGAAPTAEVAREFGAVQDSAAAVTTGRLAGIRSGITSGDASEMAGGGAAGNAGTSAGTFTHHVHDPQRDIDHPFHHALAAATAASEHLSGALSAQRSTLAAEAPAAAVWYDHLLAQKRNVAARMGDTAAGAAATGRVVVSVAGDSSVATADLGLAGRGAGTPIAPDAGATGPGRPHATTPTDVLPRPDGGDDDGAALTWHQHYAWARSLVWSRAIGLWGGPTLVPLADFMNHNHPPSVMCMARTEHLPTSVERDPSRGKHHHSHLSGTTQDSGNNSRNKDDSSSNNNHKDSIGGPDPHAECEPSLDARGRSDSSDGHSSSSHNSEDPPASASASAHSTPPSEDGDDPEEVQLFVGYSTRLLPPGSELSWVYCSHPTDVGWLCCYGFVPTDKFSSAPQADPVATQAHARMQEVMAAAHEAAELTAEAERQSNGVVAQQPSAPDTTEMQLQAEAGNVAWAGVEVHTGQAGPECVEPEVGELGRFGAHAGLGAEAWAVLGERLRVARRQYEEAESVFEGLLHTAQLPLTMVENNEGVMVAGDERIPLGMVTALRVFLQREASATGDLGAR